MNVTLRQLRVFRAAAQELNFSRAGDAVGLTQPAVSRSILELEVQLGLKLLDEITIVFCGSKKSLASGIPMAHVLFAASTVGAIVLPLMLFHQMQLMVCAVLAQRYARRPPEAGEAVEVLAAPVTAAAVASTPATSVAPARDRS